MTKPEPIALATARRLLLASQGLDRPPAQPADKAAVLATIQQMGQLQIDTIHVIARSPYLVLWSRLGDYPCAWLDALLAEGALFEGWAHAACFLPMSDYPLHRRRLLDAQMTREWGPVRWGMEWLQEHAALADQLRAYLRANGVARSADFARPDRPSNGWWDWKEEKHALEALLYTGEVMIAARQNFQRIYALREDVLAKHPLPGWDDATLPTTEEMRRQLDLRAVAALGIATAAWVPDYFRQPKLSAKRLVHMADDGQLVRAQIEGLPGLAYIHPDRLPLLDAAATGESTVTTVLSPFDPIVWDRWRARELFNFDYTIECYTPAAKRRYGYFTLPILHRGQLVGRLDPKAHRRQGVFEVKALHLEPGVEVTDALRADLTAALRRLADWHGTPELRFNPTGAAL